MESGRVRHYPFVRFRPAVGARRGRGRSAPRGRDATPAPAYPDLSSRGRGVLCAPGMYVGVGCMINQGGGVILTHCQGAQWYALERS
eukprot:4876766-Prymnesium_polylepis.2